MAAIGPVFSSLESVPLFGLVVRGLLEYRSIRAEGRTFPSRWPLSFIVASTFWNVLGAGVIGFLINLPLVDFFEHGTNLTMDHAHGALFGVNGMLSIALLLFAWRGLVKIEVWSDRPLATSFRGLNVGLLLLTFLTLFPVGIMQAWTSFQQGVVMARDASFFQRPADMCRGNLRLLPLVVFLFKTYPQLKTREIEEGGSVWERLGVDL